MKKFYYLPLALAAFAFSACSSDDAVTPDGGKTVADLEGGYMTLAINLPTQNATRAGDNGDNDGILDDGQPSEYAVTTAKLLLFEGTAEGTATFHSAYDLGNNFAFKNDANTQITSTLQITKSLNNHTSANTNFYALVVLNDNGLLDFTATDAVHSGATSATLAGNTLSDQTTYNAVVEYITTAESTGKGIDKFMDGTKHITMFNAPLSTVQGSGTVEPSSVTIQTLAKIDGDKVYPTAGEAANNPAATIYVERAVAKVTVEDPADSYTLSTASTANGTAEENKVTATVDAWQLDLTNSTSYLIHKYTTDDKGTLLTWNLKSNATDNIYRMLGSGDVTEGEKAIKVDDPNNKTTKLYRLYWGVDPNYSAAGTFEKLADTDNTTANAKTKVTGAFVSGNTENAQYCLENTFNVDNMLQDRTTRIIVKATVTPAKVITSVTDSKETLGNLESPSNDFYYCPQSNKYYSEAGLKAVIKDICGYTSEITFDATKKNGVINSIKEGNNDVSTTVISKLGKIYYYAGGVCYYPIRIKHFGDNLTPWNSTEYGTGTKPAAGDAASIYPTNKSNRDGDYLGRYGVLRNNWYDISINSIKAPGTPSIPEPSETPDDELNNYISFKINILSWAKRTQSADL